MIVDSLTKTSYMYKSLLSISCVVYVVMISQYLCIELKSKSLLSFPNTNTMPPLVKKSNALFSAQCALLPSAVLWCALALIFVVYYGRCSAFSKLHDRTVQSRRSCQITSEQGMVGLVIREY